MKYYRPAFGGFPRLKSVRSTAYEKLLPPLVANIRDEVTAWRAKGYPGASPTSRELLRWWFETDHWIERADGTQSQFRYYFAQREAVETVIWLFDVRRRPRQVRPDPLRRLGRRLGQHVRRGLAALRPEDGNRRGKDQGPVAPDGVELLPQAL